MSKSVQSVLLVALMLAGCQSGEEGSGSAGQTTSASGSSTGSTGSSGATDAGVTTTAPTGEASSAGEGSGSSAGETGAPTTGAPTTGEPVSCDTPEGCTGMGGGDLASFTLPFFRGKVCVSDVPQPGDPLAISLSTCLHPCLQVGILKYKYMYRCAGGTCEMAMVGYYPGTVGANCPDDVFGEFPAAACVFDGPHAITTGPILLGADPFVGVGSLVVPFMTNADVEAIAGGDDGNASVWARIEGHMQAPARLFEINLAPGNAPAPKVCSEGVAGCTCRDVGL